MNHRRPRGRYVTNKILGLWAQISCCRRDVNDKNFLGIEILLRLAAGRDTV